MIPHFYIQLNNFQVCWEESIFEILILEIALIFFKIVLMIFAGFGESPKQADWLDSVLGSTRWDLCNDKDKIRHRQRQPYTI